MKDSLPECVEDSLFKPHTDAYISLPQKAPEDAIFRTEDPIDTLERIKRLYCDWIIPGHRSGDETHNVSATIYVGDGEWDKVAEWMWENRDYYAALSVFPKDNHCYQQMPFTECTKEEYNRLSRRLHEIDLNSIVETGDDTEHNGEVACGGGACELTQV